MHLLKQFWVDHDDRAEWLKAIIFVTPGPSLIAGCILLALELLSMASDSTWDKRNWRQSSLSWLMAEWICSWIWSPPSKKSDYWIYLLHCPTTAQPFCPKQDFLGAPGHSRVETQIGMSQTIIIKRLYDMVLGHYEPNMNPNFQGLTGTWSIHGELSNFIVSYFN